MPKILVIASGKKLVTHKVRHKAKIANALFPSKLKPLGLGIKINIKNIKMPTTKKEFLKLIFPIDISPLSVQVIINSIFYGIEVLLIIGYIELI
ncbi:MAG: hypothetical protein R6V14_04335 [Halanaerobiales bacterium]